MAFSLSVILQIVSGLVVVAVADELVDMVRRRGLHVEQWQSQDSVARGRARYDSGFCIITMRFFHWQRRTTAKKKNKSLRFKIPPVPPSVHTFPQFVEDIPTYAEPQISRSSRDRTSYLKQ